MVKKLFSRKCYLCNYKQLLGITNTHTLFRFPKNPDLRNAWKKACKMNIDDHVQNCYICEKHFNAQDFQDKDAKARGGRLILKDYAVPVRNVKRPVPAQTIASTFKSEVNVDEGMNADIPTEQIKEEPVDNLASYLATSIEQYKVLAEIEETNTAEDDHATDPLNLSAEDTKVSSLTAEHRSKTPDLSTPERARRHFKCAQDKVRKQRTAIKTLQQKNRRLRGRVQTLQDLFQSYVKQKSHFR